MHTPNESLTTPLAKIHAIERAFDAAYNRAIEIIGDPYVRQLLEECQRSHVMRCDILREEVEDLGGTLDIDACDAEYAIGDVFGEDAAINALHALETRCASHYRDLCNGTLIDFDIRDLIQGDMEPEADRTAAIMSSLKQEH